MIDDFDDSEEEEFEDSTGVVGLDPVVLAEIVRRRRVIACLVVQCIKKQKNERAARREQPLFNWEDHQAPLTEKEFRLR